MDPADQMVLAADAIKAINLTSASDEALALFQSLICHTVKTVAKEQGDRQQARFDSLMNHSTFEEALETIRGER